MRIIFISDLHGNFTALNSLPKADLLLVGGDFTQLGSDKDFLAAVDKVSSIAPDFLAISGNMDPANGDALLAQTGHLATLEQPVTAHNLNIRGIGGSHKCPCPTPNEWDDAEMDARLQALPDNCADILITHASPFGSGADVISNGMSVGSKAIANLVKRSAIPLLLCGHIHEAPGIFNMSGTIVINPGMFGDNGNYVDIRLEQGEKPSAWLAQAISNK